MEKEYERSIPRHVMAEGETLGEAKQALQKLIPAGLDLMDEKILCDGIPVKIRAVGETLDAAFTEAASKVAEGFKVIDRKELTGTKEESITLQAKNESQVRSKALSIRSLPGAEVIGVSLKEQGNRGFLGIGSKPNTYEVNLHQKAVVEVTAKRKAIVQGLIGLKPRPKCDRCGKPSEMLMDVQLQDAATNRRSPDMKVCFECYTGFLNKAVGIRME
jgi:hypothetical protein